MHLPSDSNHKVFAGDTAKNNDKYMAIYHAEYI
jgi:hypothetical protein